MIIWLLHELWFMHSMVRYKIIGTLFQLRVSHLCVASIILEEGMKSTSY